MECRGNVFENQAGDPVWTRYFVVWCATESFLQYRWGDASGDHRDGVFWVGCNVEEPRERRSLWECGVRRDSLWFQAYGLV